MRLALIILQRPGFISLWIASVSPTYFDFMPVINSTSHLFVRVKGFSSLVAYLIRLLSSVMNSFLLLYASAKLATFLQTRILHFLMAIHQHRNTCLSFRPSFWSFFNSLSLA